MSDPTPPAGAFRFVPRGMPRHPNDDMPVEYAIELRPDVPGGCIIYGRYEGRRPGDADVTTWWRVNVNGRGAAWWLLDKLGEVTHRLVKLDKAAQKVAHRSSDDDFAALRKVLRENRAARVRDLVEDVDLDERSVEAWELEGDRRLDGGGRTYHVHATKAYVLRVIATQGAGEILKGWQGTDDEALVAVATDPREFFTFGCDDVDDTGKCRGHEVEVTHYGRAADVPMCGGEGETTDQLLFLNCPECWRLVTEKLERARGVRVRGDSGGPDAG